MHIKTQRQEEIQRIQDLERIWKLGKVKDYPTFKVLRHLDIRKKDVKKLCKPGFKA